MLAGGERTTIHLLTAFSDTNDIICESRRAPPSADMDMELDNSNIDPEDTIHQSDTVSGRKRIHSPIQDCDFVATSLRKLNNHDPDDLIGVTYNRLVLQEIVQPTGAAGNANLCMDVVDNSHLDVDESATMNNNSNMTINDIVNSVDNNKEEEKKKTRRRKKQNRDQQRSRQRERNKQKS